MNSHGNKRSQAQRSSSFKAESCQSKAEKNDELSRAVKDVIVIIFSLSCPFQ